MFILYIPPTGFQFRLVNKYTNNVILARDGGLNDYSGAEIYDDQWFTLEDVGEKTSTISKVPTIPMAENLSTQRAPESGSTARGTLTSAWYVLEAGTSNMLGGFRIRNDYSGMVIASKGSKDLDYRRVQLGQNVSEPTYRQITFHTVDILLVQS